MLTFLFVISKPPSNCFTVMRYCLFNMLKKAFNRQYHIIILLLAPYKMFVFIIYNHHSNAACPLYNPWKCPSTQVAHLLNPPLHWISNGSRVGRLYQTFNTLLDSNSRLFKCNRRLPFEITESLYVITSSVG